MSDNALTRIAQLETELAQLRAQARGNQQPAFDKAAFLADPSGYMRNQMKLTDQEYLHVNRVNLAMAMGDQAPEALRSLTYQGPLIAQQSALATQIEQLSRQVQDMVSGKTKEATVTSLKAQIADKSKYPHLAKAYAENPALYEARMNAATGTAEEIAKSFEDEAAGFAKAFGYAHPASDNAGDKKEAPSQQSKPAPLVGGSQGDPPPLPKPQEGEWTPEEDQRVRADLARKYNIPKELL